MLSGYGPYTPRALIEDAMISVPVDTDHENFIPVATELIIAQLVSYGYLNERDV